MSDMMEQAHDWRLDAPCRGLAPMMDPPENPGITPPEWFMWVDMLCSSCPVKDKCRDLGEMESPHFRHGVWGGEIWVLGKGRRIRCDDCGSHITAGKRRHCWLCGKPAGTKTYI